MDNVTVSDFLAVMYPAGVPGDVCIARRANDRFRHYSRQEGGLLDGEIYACVSTVRPAPRLRRRKGDCVTACVVMLDDIGTKVDVPPVPPTAML